MIINIFFYLLVIIWTVITGLFIFVLIKYRKTLISTIKILQQTKNNLSNNTEQFELFKRQIEEINKISQRIKK